MLLFARQQQPVSADGPLETWPSSALRLATASRRPRTGSPAGRSRSPTAKRRPKSAPKRAGRCQTARTGAAGIRDHSPGRCSGGQAAPKSREMPVVEGAQTHSGPRLRRPAATPFPAVARSGVTPHCRAKRRKKIHSTAGSHRTYQMLRPALDCPSSQTPGSVGGMWCRSHTGSAWGTAATVGIANDPYWGGGGGGGRLARLCAEGSAASAPRCVRVLAKRIFEPRQSRAAWRLQGSVERIGSLPFRGAHGAAAYTQSPPGGACVVNYLPSASNPDRQRNCFTSSLPPATRLNSEEATLREDARAPTIFPVSANAPMLGVAN